MAHHQPQSGDFVKTDVANHDVIIYSVRSPLTKRWLIGQVTVENLTAAVGSFAIAKGLVDASKVPKNGICEVRIWQQNISKTIIAHVPMTDGPRCKETGDFELDGVTFPAAKSNWIYRPCGQWWRYVPRRATWLTNLMYPEIGWIWRPRWSMRVSQRFLNAKDLGFTGAELQRHQQ